jgi:hypothetical protein
MTGPVYESVDAFYAADRRRATSPELDFGVWWRHAGVIYRLTWVDDTGELIAVQLTRPRVVPFGLPPEGYTLGGLGVAVFGGEPQQVTVLATVEGRDQVEQLLDGWGGVCGGDDSLAWVLERIRSVAV